MDVSERGPAATRRLRLGPLPLTSKRLAARAAAGDQRAFTQIFERHHQELYRYCLAILRRPADAEDALQSTMSKALGALPGESREIELRPWLFRVAHNESISILRERSAATTELDEQSAGPDRDGPVAQAELSERMRELVADLGSLPDRQRSALVMRELSGLGYTEIASALDCGEGAARQTVYEARTALQMREEGRSMECAEVRHALSDGDRRRLRGRKVRAHLSGCQGCSDFEAAITARRTDLAALCPPLPAAAAAGMLGGLLSSGAGVGIGAGAVGAGAGSIAGGVGSAAAIKGASVVAALALAAGGADAIGVIDLPNPLRGSGGGNEKAAPAAHPNGTHGAGGSGSAAHNSGSGGSGTADAGRSEEAGNGSGGQNAHGKGEHGQGKGEGPGGAQGQGENQGQGNGQGSDVGTGGEAGNSGKIPPGQSDDAGTNGNGSTGETGPPDNSNAGGNGNGSGVPGGGTSTAPGQTGAAPGQSKESGTSAGNGVPAGGSGSSNAGGNGIAIPPDPPASGNSATAPGQTKTPPATSNIGGGDKEFAETT